MSTTVGAAAVDGRAIVADHTMADERNGAVPSSGASAEQGARTPSDHVVMCGPDGIGARIAEQLTRAGESMVVLFEFAGPAHAAIIQGQSVTVVDPIGGVAQTLNAAGIDRAKAVICGWTASPAVRPCRRRRDHPLRTGPGCRAHRRRR